MTTENSRGWWLMKLIDYNQGVTSNSPKPLDVDAATVPEIARFIASREKFIRAYIQTATWATNDESTPSGGEPLDATYTDGADDFADEAIVQIVQECLEFMEQNYDDLNCDGVQHGPDFDQDERAGHDFFLTRNNHGAGFWDGAWPEEEGERLSESARRFGTSEPYIGDDELLYVA
jgi:hypothetical protein